MPKRRQVEIPAHSELVDYGHAVAGHAGTLCDESGEFFIKPVHQQEVNFYEATVANHPDFTEIMPPFRGTLTATEPVPDSDSSASPTLSESESKPKEEWAPGKNRKLDTHQYIVLENSSKGFTHANILDAKLGFRLWADDAPQAKKDRFDKIADSTTHKNFGFRIAGMRVYQPGAEAPEAKDGRKPPFRVEADYKVYDKDFGRSHVSDHNLKESLRSYVFNHASGIDEDLGKAVCAAFVHDLEKIRDTLEKAESRMYSASCLFVFEGDGQSLRKAIEEQNARVDKINRVMDKKGEHTTAARQDSSVFLGDSEKTQPEAKDDEGLVLDEEEEDEQEEQEHRTCSVRLIDFAHAAWTPGQGPDENSLRGVRNLITLFKELAA